MKLIELKVKLIKKVIKKLKVTFVIFYFFNWWFQGSSFTNNGNDKYILHLKNILYFIYVLFIYTVYIYCLIYKIMNTGLSYD